MTVSLSSALQMHNNHSITTRLLNADISKPEPSAHSAHHGVFSTDRESLINHTKESLLRHLNGGPTHPRYPVDSKRLNKILPTYSDATLNRIINAPQETSAHVLGVIRQTTSNDENINDWISVEPVINAAGGWAEDAVLAIPTYKHIASYAGPQTSRRIIQARALISVSIHLFTHRGGELHFRLTRDSNGNRVRHIADEKLTTLILTHNDPIAVALIITTRNLTDSDQITAIYDTMSNTQNAISDGTL
jgi:hypothetical protein